MDVLTRLGLFLLLFGVIVFGSKLLLTRKTREELKVMKDPVPAYFQSQNRLLMRLIFILVLAMIGFYIIFVLR